MAKAVTGAPTLTNYRVERELGSGAMGKVYSAHDLRLRRDVALKVLPGEVADRPGWTERFKREAQSLAALNHPNVVAIYSVEEEEETHFIVMEKVVGRSLDKHIPRDGLSLKEFLDLAIQMADGMAAAEKAGISHRDLKPANVMMTEDGRIKIVDLGLAKLIETDAVVDSAMATVQVTQPGGVPGSPAYMSPEQIEGQPLDHRSDVFSLGVIFFEMLTGRRPFGGPTVAAVMSSILRDQAPILTEVKPDLPTEMVRIVRRCLEKNPSERFQSALDLRNALQDVRSELLATQTGMAVQPAGKRPLRWQKIIPATLAVVVAAVAIHLSLRGGDGGPVPGIPREDSGAESQAAIPPPRPKRPHRWSSVEAVAKWPRPSFDGSLVAYSVLQNGYFQIFVKPADGGPAHAITEGERDHIMPAWSPDGQRIAYVRANSDSISEGTMPGKIKPSDVYGGFYAVGGDLWIARSDGSDARLLVEEAFSPSFNHEGELIFSRASDQGHGIFRIWGCDDAGRGLRELSSDDDGIQHLEPSWSPDGKTFALRRQVSKYGSEIAVVDRDTRKLHSLTPVGLYSEPQWSPEGRLIYFVYYQQTGFNIWRVEVNAGGGRAARPQQVTFGPGPDITPALSPDGDTLYFSVVPWNSDIWLLPVNEEGDPEGDARPLITSAGEDSRLSWSDDEKVVAFCSSRDGDMSIYAAPFDPETGEAGTPVRLTQGGVGGHYQPSVGRAGREIVYFGRVDGNEDIYRITLSENLEPLGSPIRLTEDPAPDHSAALSPDGKHIVWRSAKRSDDELWLMNANGTGMRFLGKATGHYTPWWDDQSLVARMPDDRDLVPETSYVVMRVFVNGREPELLGIHGGGHIALSPDRQWVVDNNHLEVLKAPLRSRTKADMKTIFKFPDGSEMDYTVWAPSGRWIAVDKNSVRSGDIQRLDGLAP